MAKEWVAEWLLEWGGGVLMWRAAMLFRTEVTVSGEFWNVGPGIPECGLSCQVPHQRA